MRNKPRIIKTLSAFTALASMMAPNYGHAESKSLPSIELNFDVLEKLRHSEKAKQAEEKAKKAEESALKKKAEKKSAKTQKEAKETKETPPSKKVAAKKDSADKQKKGQLAKKTEKVIPIPQEKPIVEIQKEIVREATPVPEEKIENLPVVKANTESEKVRVQPETIEVKEIAEEKKPAIEIKKADKLEETVGNNATDEKKDSFSSFWKSLPFMSKKEQAAGESPAPVVQQEAPVEELPVASKPSEPEKSEIIEEPVAEEKPQEKKASVSSFWNKMPFVSKTTPENEAVQDDTASAQKPKEEEQADIYDDKHVEEFIGEKSSGAQPDKGAAVNNISSYTGSELDKQTAKEELRQARIKARREAAEQKIRDSKTIASAPEKSIKPVETEKQSPPMPIAKPEEKVSAKPEQVEPEPMKNARIEEKELLPQEQELPVVEIHEEPNKEEIAATELPEAVKPKNEIQDVPVAQRKSEEKPVEVKPEQSWQQFLAEAKRKAGNLESENMPKVADQHIINNNSVVALRPEDKKAKEAPKPEKSPEEKKVAEAQPEVIEVPAAEVLPEKKPEEHIKTVEVKKPDAIVPAPAKPVEPTPSQEVKPEEEITTNADVPAPVIKKQEKATLSLLMDKLPYFNENKTELKNDAIQQKAEAVKKEPEIPTIHEVKSIPVEVENEVSPAANNIQEESPTEKMGVLGKMLDKELTPPAAAPSGRDVVISENVDRKLDDAIDSKIMHPAPPVPDIASIPAELTSKEPENKPDNNVASNGNGIILSMAFDANNIVLNEADKTRLSDLVGQILNSNRRFKIVSYAQGVDGEINSARRISLQRAIAVRAEMIRAGLEKNRINVQAVGNNTSDQEFANSVNIYEVQ